jgi:hypothetical protein
MLTINKIEYVFRFVGIDHRSNFLVNVETDTATWSEVFTTEAEVHAFIRGAKAAASMVGDHSIQINEKTLAPQEIETGDKLWKDI